MDPEKLVALISPWEKLSVVVQHNFRIESLPAEKKVIVWREDLQAEEALTEELKRLGVPAIELRRKRVTANWEDVE